MAAAGFSGLRVSCAVAMASAAFYYAPTLSELNELCPNLALGVLIALLVKDYILPTVMTWAYVGPHMNTRRKVMISTWEEPGRSGEIYTELMFDMTEALKYIEEKKVAGKRVTITHIVLKAVGNALRAVPSVNGRIIFGRFIPFDKVDVSCLVRLEEGKDLAMARIADADKKDVFEIAESLMQQASKLHAGKDEDYNKSKSTMSMLSTGMLRKVIHTVGWLAGGLGLQIPALGVKRFVFGGAMVSSIGSMGLDTCYIPFTPWARVPLVVCVGAMTDRAVVETDPKTGAKAVVIRPMLTITATIDHRFMDGSQGAQLAKEIRATVANPSVKLNGCDSWSQPA
jgi:pyruvate/2-oxoglutarate dehydrogenase complex dihydrolipoamide acyltransferase (E2) component